MQVSTRVLDGGPWEHHDAFAVARHIEVLPHAGSANGLRRPDARRSHDGERILLSARAADPLMVGEFDSAASGCSRSFTRWLRPAGLALFTAAACRPCASRASLMAFASPKSSTFTFPSGVILMLAGFRSR